MTTTNLKNLVDKLREETPGTKEWIHFNNAGAALMPSPVAEGFKEYFECEVGLGGYETFNKYESKLNGFYDKAAQLLNCQPNEIAFIENATRAWDMAFYSFPFKKGDLVLTSVAEYASNYISYLQLQKSKGIEIEVIPNDDSEQTSVEQLEKLLKERPETKLIAITHIPTNGGLVNPAKEIGMLAKQYNVTYLLDACQSVGQLNVDVKEIGCHFLSATGRKYLRGPRGTGFLYVNQDLIEKIEPIFLDVHAADWVSQDSYKIRDDAKRFENWEQNFAGKHGLALAIEYALELGLDWIEERVLELASYKRQRLAEIKQLNVSDAGEKKCGIVSFYSEKFSPEELVVLLKRDGFNLSTSSVYGTRLDMERRKLPTLLRSSLHYYNTKNEIDALITKLAEHHS